MAKPKYKLLSKACKLSDSIAMNRVLLAYDRLREARDLLREAGCPLALQRVQLAIASTKGAVRNVSHRPYRRQRQIPPCAASMGCLCAGHARGNRFDAPCDTSEGG